jgi:hypothetical protein
MPGALEANPRWRTCPPKQDDLEENSLNERPLRSYKRNENGLLHANLIGNGVEETLVALSPER